METDIVLISVAIETLQAPTPPTTSMPTFLKQGNVRSQSITLVEDVNRQVGGEIATIVQSTLPTSVRSISISGFPSGSTVAYVDTNRQTVNTTVPDSGLDLVFSDPSEANLYQSLKTLTVIDTPQDDNDFQLMIQVANGNDPMAVQAFPLDVAVLAVADMPMVAAQNIAVLENVSAPLVITATASSDADGSEILLVELCVGNGPDGVPIGTLAISDVAAITGITFSALERGNYLVEAAGSTPQEHETILNNFFSSGGIVFNPSTNGDFPEGIKVRAISRETGKECHNHKENSPLIVIPS